MITSMIASLGTITPAFGFVSPLAAIIIGFLAGSICYYVTITLKQKLKIDDSLDVLVANYELGNVQ